MSVCVQLLLASKSGAIAKHKNYSANYGSTDGISGFGGHPHSGAVVADTTTAVLHCWCCSTTVPPLLLLWSSTVGIVPLLLLLTPQQ